MNEFFETFLRLAGAIALDTLALVVWNVGTRAPGRLVRDLAQSARSARSLFVSAVGLAIGLIFVASATVTLYPIVPSAFDFAPVEIFTLLIALLVEQLIGNDLRRLAGGGRP